MEYRIGVNPLSFSCSLLAFVFVMTRFLLMLLMIRYPKRAGRLGYSDQGEPADALDDVTIPVFMLSLLSIHIPPNKLDCDEGDHLIQSLCLLSDCITNDKGLA